jgi:putative tryptophan/tyrosine transport system substrate-binding protein
MLATIKRLALGISLIGFAAVILLYSDLDSRKSSRTQAGLATPSDKVLRVALVQQASITALEEGATGVVAALAERGYEDGDRLELKRYNAEADIGTANAIAKEVTSGGYDLIVSMSTISLQTIANANKFGAKTLHVFGLVSDPFSAGVGIDAANPAVHPSYLTGYGSMAPVSSIFRVARQMRPELKRVGLAWNPAEANSLAQTKLARKVCEELGIKLIEVNAENSTAAMEAANSLIARGVEAIWISGDITISLASDQILEAARRAKIPVFTALPGKVDQGALFDLGANYVEVGRSVGNLAADVLDGKKNPADIPIKNFLPEVFLLNETVPESLKDRWTITEDLRQRAKDSINADSPKPNVSNASAR